MTDPTRVPDDREQKVPTGAEQKGDQPDTRIPPPPPDQRIAKGAGERQESK